MPSEEEKATAGGLAKTEERRRRVKFSPSRRQSRFACPQATVPAAFQGGSVKSDEARLLGTGEIRYHPRDLDAAGTGRSAIPQETSASPGS
jgi:hypothetical protein